MNLDFNLTKTLIRFSMRIAQITRFFPIYSLSGILWRLDRQRHSPSERGPVLGLSFRLAGEFLLLGSGLAALVLPVVRPGQGVAGRAPGHKGRREALHREQPRSRRDHRAHINTLEVDTQLGASLGTPHRSVRPGLGILDAAHQDTLLHGQSTQVQHHRCELS